MKDIMSFFAWRINNQMLLLAHLCPKEFSAIQKSPGICSPTATSTSPSHR